MIRNTLQATKLATFSVDLPNKQFNGMPSPSGTGFFVSPDGWFITAAHVITEDVRADGRVRSDVNQCWLMKEPRAMGKPGAMCKAVSFDYIDPVRDIALLRVDFSQNSQREWLKGYVSFPYIEISRRELEEGEPVYAFGYPLPDATAYASRGVTVGSVSHRPRVTSAIVAAKRYEWGMVVAGSDPQQYVLDKALNYGNSGGPIVAQETGKVHAICSSFQPLRIPQRHLGQDVAILVPSLYGTVSRLSDPPIIKELEKRNIPIAED